MSRSNYVEPCDADNINLYRGSVARALNGKRGQAFLRRLLVSLDALPEKRLIANGFVTSDGCCAMGAVMVHETIEDPDANADDHAAYASVFNIAPSLVAEIEFENDEAESGPESPEQRWARMRNCVVCNLKE